MWRLLRRIGRLNPLLLGPFKINLGSLGSNGFQVAIRRFERIGIGVASCTTICVIAIPGYESRIRWYLELVESLCGLDQNLVWFSSHTRLPIRGKCVSGTLILRRCIIQLEGR
jgi:hypothetical protein